MLTGRWPEAHRVRITFDMKDAFFEKNLYQVAKEVGYRTGLAGKNHTYLKAGDLDVWRAYGHTAGWQPPHPDTEVVAYDEWLKKRYQTKWPGKHNWYAPYRHGSAPEAFIG